jgi:hypothetical protein
MLTPKGPKSQNRLLGSLGRFLHLQKHSWFSEFLSKVEQSTPFDGKEIKFNLDL